MKITCPIIVFILLIGINSYSQQTWDWVTDVPIVNYDELQENLIFEDDVIYVVNYWATWCKPCVEELPYLEKINDEFKDKNVKVILVSLDFEGQTKKRLIPFINKNKISSEVFHLIDPRMDFWINEVHQKWSGAIPATVIYYQQEKVFFEGAFDSYENLADVIKPFLL